MHTQEKLKGIIDQIFSVMPKYLDERQKRILSGCIASGYGHGGIKIVSEASGMDPKTIRSGIREISSVPENETNDQPDVDYRVRHEGAGRPGIEVKYPNITECIQTILDTNTYGDPEKVLTWTNLSLRGITDELASRYGILTNKNVVADVMAELGYSRQVNQKQDQVGVPHKDRNAQFEFINSKAKEFIASKDPVISVDTKKKELIGNFKNNGAEYRPKKEPRRVLDHDFPLEGGKVSPYGVYVVNNNTAFVNLGTDHDTSAFAVESIRRWWNIVGRSTFPSSNRIYTNCDGGGSNGWRVRLWKYELALFAEEVGIEIHVSHFPPGTSKWNKVEHRLFCFITKNWAGKPLIDINTTVNLISSTTNTKGLEVKCEVDQNEYPAGIKLDDSQMEAIDIIRCGEMPSWNYIIKGFKRGI